jgi:fluoroacetyl-CoA thioesterase
MFEHAAIEALRASVGPDLRTLGVGLALSHDAPTPVGFQVTVDAVLVDVRGRRLRFELQARDDLETVATGTHDRVIVEWDRALAAVARKSERVASTS